MPLDKLVKKQIAQSFKDLKLHRDFQKNFEVKGRTRKRPLQFLRPEIYCFAYPDYQRNMARNQYITAKVVNAGGAPSNNAIVQLVRFHSTNPPQTATQRITLQPGQTKDLRFAFTLPLPTLSNTKYQLACFDPLHDPITQQALDQASAKSCLVNATEPKILANGQFSDWVEWSLGANGKWQPTATPTWTTRANNLSHAISSLLQTKRCFATTDQTPRAGSQLRQVVSIATLGLDSAMLQQLNNGQLRASFDGLIYLHSNSQQTQGWIEIEFENSAGTQLSKFQTQIVNSLNSWIRTIGSISVPSNSANIIFKIFADRPPGTAMGQVYFDELHLCLTPRKIFSSERIYSP